MNLKYEPSSEPPHNFVKLLFLNRTLYRTVQLSELVPQSFEHLRQDGLGFQVSGLVLSAYG